ncbi:hypothetical protein M9H77_35028 [Catharanthus roseus]|uniref:Uncharacterized protein n=1 Tax=Catharanthus roseus TaxID=4058 RepID=A0ACB9ZN51_CATRO|nr:hypothetical protein M9H77_35028 [Catharanthus roseus]
MKQDGSIKQRSQFTINTIAGIAEYYSLQQRQIASPIFKLFTKQQQLRQKHSEHSEHVKEKSEVRVKSSRKRWSVHLGVVADRRRHNGGGSRASAGGSWE